MTQLVLQVEKLIQRHVQKTVELAQHLFGSLAKRHALRRQVNKNASFIFCLSSSCHQSLRLKAFEHRRKRAQIHLQRRGQLSDALRPTLPKHDQNQILGVGDAELLKERYEQARHVIAGSVERKAKMIVEPRHLDRRERTLTASIPCFQPHVHCSCFHSGQTAPGKGEPLVEPNPIVSRRASQAAPAQFATTTVYSIKIVSHMIDS